MLVISIQTDNPEATITLHDGYELVDSITWQAHRQLAATLHSRLDELLQRNHKTYEDISGYVGYKGPGSFTGLRIGLSVVNALAYSYHAGAVATHGEQWQREGIARLISGDVDPVVLPEYGSAPNITTQKH